MSDHFDDKTENELVMTAIDHSMPKSDTAILNTILTADPYYPMTLITPRYNTQNGKERRR